MPFHQSEDWSNTTSSALSSVRSNAIDKSNYSIIVCERTPAFVHYKLAKQFELTLYTAELNLDCFDAIFVDCRGTKIQNPCAITSGKPQLAFTLIDEKTQLSKQTTTHASHIELITEAELDSPLLKLKIDAHKLQYASHFETAAYNPDFVEQHAFEILKAFVQSSTDWMVLKDLNNRFMVVSDRFLTSQKKTRDEIIGRNDLEIGVSENDVLGDASNNWQGFWHLDKSAIAAKVPRYTEQMIIHENALEQVRERVARVPVKDASGNVIALLVCITEIYNSKFNGTNVSSLASRSNVKMSPIIRTIDNERSKAIAMNKQTESAFRRKNNFIATASHDLRQPLHAIGLFIESLQNQIVDPIQQSTLAKMKQSSSDLNALLNSILDISKLDADAVSVSKTHFCLSSVLTSIEDEFETEAKRKSLELHIASSNAVVHTDSLLLVRILRNLVSNAIKHTQEGRVNLIIENEASTLLIHIKDTGPGIPKAQYQAIFAGHHQLEDQESQPNFGMGLGLSIVRRLTDLLNLDISLESVIGGGTQFTLKIPLGEESNRQSKKTNKKSLETFESYKLLLVEDNPVVLEAMQAMLSGMNCDAYPASDIPEALEIIEELDELPDLLIVDYQLANGVTGDTAIEEICEAANAALPAIIVTGNTNNELCRRASQSAYRVLNKPVNPDTLLRTIASAIKKHREIEA